MAVRRQWADEFDRFDHDEANASRPAHPPGLNEEEVGGTYTTVSQRAGEREQRGNPPPRPAHSSPPPTTSFV